MLADSNICLPFCVGGEWDEETGNEVPIVVYSAGAVLAAGPGGLGALPAGLAAPAALPAAGDRRGRRPRTGLGNHHPARPHAPRALTAPARASHLLVLGGAQMSLPTPAGGRIFSKLLREWLFWSGRCRRFSVPRLWGTWHCHNCRVVLSQAHFRGGRDRRLEVPRTLSAKLVAFNRHRRSSFVAAHHASVDHQLHRTRFVQQNRPGHGKLHGHAAGQHVLRAEPHAAARDVHGPAHAGFGDALPIEHLVFYFLVNVEAALDPPFPIGFAAERSVFVALDHQTPPSNRQITTRAAKAQGCLWSYGWHYHPPVATPGSIFYRLCFQYLTRSLRVVVSGILPTVPLGRPRYSIAPDGVLDGVLPASGPFRHRARILLRIVQNSSGQQDPKLLL